MRLVRFQSDVGLVRYKNATPAMFYGGEYGARRRAALVEIGGQVQPHNDVLHAGSYRRFTPNVTVMILTVGHEGAQVIGRAHRVATLLCSYSVIRYSVPACASRSPKKVSAINCCTTSSRPDARN